MMGAVFATSIYLAFLVNKTYRKIEKGKIKYKSLQLRSKKSSKPLFVSKVLSRNPSPRLKMFRLSVIIVKLRKTKSIEKFWKLLLSLTKSCQKSRYEYLKNHFIVSRLPSIPVSSLT